MRDETPEYYKKENEKKMFLAKVVSPGERGNISLLPNKKLELNKCSVIFFI